MRVKCRWQKSYDGIFYGIICNEKNVIMEKCILDSFRDIVGNVFISIYIHHVSMCVQMYIV